MERQAIREYRITVMGGEYPDIPIYPNVDKEMLYEGDPKPFHIVLPIARVGEISTNGLVYDEELVGSIEAQLPGLGGIRGHQRDEDLAFSFPVDAVDWVGHLRVGEMLWAKGYIPPGTNRDDIRRRKARGAGVGTSIYGDAVRELTGKKTWRAKEFKLESLDLGSAYRVSLKMREGFNIVSEYEEGNMPPEDNSGTPPTRVAEITIIDVPQTVREQIIKEAKIQADAGRVRELETAVAELRQYSSIVGEIRTTLGASVTDAEVAAKVAEMHNTLTGLRDMLGPDVSISVAVNEMFTQVAEFKKTKFASAVDAKIAELTPWNATSDEAKRKVNAFRNSLKRATVSELGEAGDQTKVVETVDRLWDGDFKIMSESLVLELAGPSAAIGGKGRNVQMTDIERLRTDEGIKEVKDNWGL